MVKVDDGLYRQEGREIRGREQADPLCPLDYLTSDEGSWPIMSPSARGTSCHNLSLENNLHWIKTVALTASSPTRVSNLFSAQEKWSHSNVMEATCQWYVGAEAKVGGATDMSVQETTHKSGISPHTLHMHMASKRHYHSSRTHSRQPKALEESTVQG